MGLFSRVWSGVKNFFRDVFGDDDPPPPPPPPPVIIVQSPDTVQQDLKKMEEAHQQGMEELKRRLEKAEQESNRELKRQVKEDLRREQELFTAKKQDGERRLREAQLRQQQELRDREEEARQFKNKVMEAVHRAAELHKHGEPMKALERLQRIEQRLQKAKFVELLPPDVFELVRVPLAGVQGDIGILYMRQGHFDDAVRCFDTYLMYFPDDAKRWFDRARAKLGAGHVADAVTLLRESLRDYSDSASDDLEKLVRAFADQGQSELAASVLREELASAKSLPQQSVILRLLTELHTTVSPEDLRKYLDVLLRMTDYAAALHLARSMNDIPPAAGLAMAILAESPERARETIFSADEGGQSGSATALSIALLTFGTSSSEQDQDLFDRAVSWWTALNIGKEPDRRVVADRLRRAFTDLGVRALGEWPISWRLALSVASGLTVSMCQKSKLPLAHEYALQLVNLFEMGAEEKAVAPPVAVVNSLICVVRLFEDFGRSRDAEELRQHLIVWLGEEEFKRRLNERRDEISSAEFSDRFEYVIHNGHRQELYRNAVCRIISGRFRQNPEHTVEILSFFPIYVRRERHIDGFRKAFEEQKILSEGSAAGSGVQKLIGYEVSINKAEAALEHVKGRRLSQYIDDAEVDEITFDRLAVLVESLTSVVGGIHHSQTVIGQPRPENIFFNEESSEVTVTGIGLYRPFDERRRPGEPASSSTTKDKALTQYRLNSYLYGAPEGPGTPEADQYGLAAMLYHLLVKEPPFHCKDASVLKRLHKREKVPKSAVKGLEHFFYEEKGAMVKVQLPDIAIRRPSLGYSLDPIFHKALEPDAKNRYSSIDEFGTELAARLRWMTRRKSLGLYRGDLQGLISELCKTLNEQAFEGEIRIQIPARALNDIGLILGRSSNPCRVLVVYGGSESPGTAPEGANFRFLESSAKPDKLNEVFIMLPQGMNFYYLIDEQRNQEDQFRRRVDQFDNDFDADASGDIK